MSGFNPLRARIEALTGAHECWDGDNFIERHPELLDREDVLAALGAGVTLDAARERPSDGLRENPDAKALIDGWHLTNGAIDAMNAALSKSFAIYDDPEAGTDVDGDSVTVMDRLMDNGYVVASWTALRAALEAAPVAPEPLIEVDRVAVGVGPVEAYRASLAQPDTDQPKPLACSTCGHSPYGWCGHECCRADQPESAPVEDR
jgi:hypothetical protein